jgi:membrane protease YdiL (CAAX protease family)
VSTDATTWAGAPRTGGDVEEAYHRYLSQTRVGWLALFCAVVVIATKIPPAWALPGVSWLLPDAPAVMGAVGALILSLAIARTDSRRILRGRSSWISAMCWAGVIGALGFFVHTVLIYAVGGFVAPPLRVGSTIGQLVVLVMLAPIVEECIFQLGLQTRLSRLGVVTSVVVTTLAFTLFHLDVFDRFPTSYELYARIPLFFGLLGFAIMRRCNGSLAGVIVAHAFSNVLAIQIDPLLARLP